jgi:hypothetical protein
MARAGCRDVARFLVYVRNESAHPLLPKNMEPRSWEGNKIRAVSRRIGRLISLAILASACGTDDRREPPPSRSIVADVILTIENRRSQAALIYLEAGTFRDSLGVVPRRSSRSFSLPSGAGDSTNALRLEARERRTVPGLRSEAFHLSSGHQVVWTLDRSRTTAVTMR